MRRTSSISASNVTAPVAQGLGNNVTRSLYRSLLREARTIDTATVSKVLLPIPRKLQVACGLAAPLYHPDGVKYEGLVRKAFRAHKPGDRGNPVLAFEALNMFRAHAKTIAGLLPVATKEHDGLVKALGQANPDATQYWAKPLVDNSTTTTTTTAQQEEQEQDKMNEQKRGTAAAAPSSPTNLRRAAAQRASSSSSSSSSSSPSTVRDLFSRKKMPSSAMQKNIIQPTVGMALVAHPLSSAHIDRRVILLVESNPQSTTGLVLDMFYTYPLSHGNPMFSGTGEVFWGHEVYNGGYCHVDFTMPPVANISVLHTLPPPSDSSSSNASYNARWLSWALRNKVEQTSAPQHHERLCKTLIKGDEEKGVPSLYYSKVEALPYLASLVPGQPRSALRIYWGCMRWSTSQLATEITNGHWIPVSLSPKFFAAYPVVRPPGNNVVVADTFPTEDMLRESKDLRTKLLGADVVPPQTFPPDQPVCRREALWDQIMLSMGGEYEKVVGAVNPFVNKSQQQQEQGPGLMGAPGEEQQHPGGLLESREAAVMQAASPPASDAAEGTSGGDEHDDGEHGGDDDHHDDDGENGGGGGGDGSSGGDNGGKSKK